MITLLEVRHRSSSSNDKRYWLCPLDEAGLEVTHHVSKTTYRDIMSAVKAACNEFDHISISCLKVLA